jgi:hypothetical protein
MAVNVAVMKNLVAVTDSQAALVFARRGSRT